MSVLFDDALELEKARGRAPQPPPEEQEARLARSRALLADRGVDGVVAWGSAGANADPIRYLAGYVHVFPGASSLLVLPLERDPILLVDQDWHLDEARRMSWIEDVRSFPPPARRWLADELTSAVAGALADAGLARGRVGIFSSEMPAILEDVLAAAAPEATVEEGSDVWQELVASPSAYDAEQVRRTAAIADEGLAAAVEAAAEGVPEHEVCLASLGRMAALGAEFLHGSGLSTHINIGSYSEVVSNVRPYLFSSRPLQAGQMFWLDLSASHAGCYTDTDRTISVGEPSREQREIYEVAAEMYRLMVADARAGVRGGDLWQAATQIAEDAGLGEYSNHVYLGHTTGITTSSRPVIARGETAELRSGSFVNVEPGIFVPGVGSACIENTLYVTEEGATPINRFGVEIHVV